LRTSGGGSNSGHAVVLAVGQACAPVLLGERQAGVMSEPALPVTERRQVLHVASAPGHGAN
jgi:hypothetical protein